MKYRAFEKPEKFAGDVTKFDKNKAKVFFQWFMSIKSDRIVALEEAVQSTKEFEYWKADFSIDSLVSLQKWFEKVIEMRPTTQEEKDFEIAQYKGTKFEDPFIQQIGPAEWTLTNTTESICTDVGIYFGEVFVINNPKLKWGQSTAAKKSFGINEPAVQGFYGADFHPTNLRNSAIKILEGRSDDWKELYNFWIQSLHN